MTITPAQLDRAVAQAHVRESQGYFDRARAGDQKAASLFARLIAVDLNPTASPADYGWLTKTPGESQVDGYAEDAICFGADPADLHNVVDLVNGAGAPGASIPTHITLDDVKPRRTTNLWAAPHALSVEEMAYLKGGTVPMPEPVDCASKFPPRDEVYQFGLALNTKYEKDRHAAKIGLDSNGVTMFINLEGMSIWLARYMQERVAGHSHAEAQATVFAEIDAIPL